MIPFSSICSRGLSSLTSTLIGGVTASSFQTSINTTKPVSVGQTILAIFSVKGGSADITAVTDTGGNTWAKVGRYSSGGNGTTVVVWWCQSPTVSLVSGATISFTGSSGNAFTAAVYTTDKPASSIGTNSAVISSATSFSVSASPATGGVTFGACSIDTPEAVTSDPGWTVDESTTSGNQTNIIESFQGVATSFHLSGSVTENGIIVSVWLNI